jgi:cytochrome c biogenesis protein CcmG, thiol:disulfide interchange protein DsbE
LIDPCFVLVTTEQPHDWKGSKMTLRLRGLRRALAAAVLGLAIAAALPAAPPGPGDPAPVFRLPTAADSLGPADFAGEVLWLDFWASWCEPCARSFPWLAELQRRHGGTGLRVLAVNVDRKRAKAEDFLAAHGAGFPVVFDPAGAVAAAYGLEGMPTAVLVGRDGRILWRHVGFRPEESAELERRLVAALAASPAPAAEPAAGVGR